MLTQIFAISSILTADVFTFTTALEICKTAWIDDGNVTSQGDSELFTDLKRRYWEGVCASPIDMEAQTVSGIKSQYTKNFFHRTRWFDHDDPTGNGDYEVLSVLLCHRPIAIEAQTVYGEPASSTSDRLLIYDATYGFACVNADQGNRHCQDYRVRFTCPTEFCQVSEECRIGWLSAVGPSEEGDVESVPQLLKAFPGQVCQNPISLEDQTTCGISAEHTGESFLSSHGEFGFVCIDSAQRTGQCQDYRVMLTCPSDCCQGCRTTWLDLDDPSGRGDYETLLQLQLVYPKEVCPQPLTIEAMTVEGTPALQSGDVLQVYDTTHGFACVNAEQPGGRRCQDYKVRFTCPLNFCSVDIRST